MKHSNKNLPLLFKVENFLGPLEREVMLVIWKKGKINVGEVLKTLKTKKKLAYTTIMTVMDKLYKKGFLKREKIGKAYWYSPAVKENIIISNSLSWVFQDLAKSYGRKKVLLATLSLMPTFSNKLIKEYKKPVLLSFSFGIILAFFVYSLFELWQNLNFFGIFDYFKILLSEIVFYSKHWYLALLAIGENLPLINILTTTFLLFLIIFFSKKLIKLKD
ncbi:MAG: BlaI/MecI/CopY family transcriptional regulator [Microgenomates group bacterium]